MAILQHAPLSLSSSPCLAFLLVRGLSIPIFSQTEGFAALHIFQAWKYRMWFFIPTAILCGVGEVAGWSGRLWASINVMNDNAFMIQYVDRLWSIDRMLTSSTEFVARLSLLHPFSRSSSYSLDGSFESLAPTTACSSRGCIQLSSLVA